MGKFQIAALMGVLLAAILCFADGISVSCMEAYEEGGAFAVLSSPECYQSVLSTRNSTMNCQFATFQGHRAYQEDRIICNLDMKIPFLGMNGHEEITIGVAAVFDGHGGKEASEMASKKLIDYLLWNAMLSSYNQTVSSNRSIYGILEEALLKTIEDIDFDFSLEALDKRYTAGSTLTALLLVDGQFLIANVGDSKAIICSRKIHSHSNTVKELHAEQLTRDHHPDREDEKARIEAAGGFVHVWGVPRVNGILAVSRAIGDISLKRFGLTAEPEVTGWRRLTDEDVYMVVASDGIFETLTPQNVCDLIHGEALEESSECSFASSLANCVVQAAFKRGSMDNLSVILIPLKLPLTGATAAHHEL